MAIKPEVVKSIFVDLLFVIGVILAIIGFVKSTSTIVKLAVFDKYPLPSYEETRCDLEGLINIPGYSAKDIGETNTKKEVCLKSLESQRKLALVEDISSSTSLLVSGLFLTMVFKGFIFEEKKKS